LPRHLIEELERLPGSSRGEKIERALKFAIDEGLFEESLNLTRNWREP